MLQCNKCRYCLVVAVFEQVIQVFCIRYNSVFIYAASVDLSRDRGHLPASADHDSLRSEPANKKIGQNSRSISYYSSLRLPGSGVKAP
jgi:hypothetical protein